MDEIVERSVHDNTVLGYAVDCESCTLLIRTEHRAGAAPFERTNIKFNGLIGYFLRDGLHGVLFEVEEDSLDRILRDHGSDFSWGKKYGWPWATAGRDDPHDYVAAQGGRVFRIQGQSCFEGFVIAQAMTLEASR